MRDVTPAEGMAAAPPRRIRLRWYLLGIVLAALAVGTMPWWGHDLAFFRVQQVEVRGTRYARPADIAARLEVDTTFSIWGNLDSLRVRAEAHPQVRSARISRRLPSTLVVTVEENLPIALVPGPSGFKVYDDSGRPLPLDPARWGVDLPIVPRADTALFRLLADVRAEWPEYYARVSEARRVGKDEVYLQLVDVGVRAMLDLSTDRLLQLSSVEADLAKRRLRPVELDLRYKDLVIARLP
ncbi:MAG TPA: FtsQ-type POTRA domain-containing protein [Gemmatimonadaceae bacterium]|nr:FtsQ-type POTRA domain-containing protein [Gemmatimonadaceae bacterium]